MRHRGRETRILRFRLHTAAKKYAEHGCRYTAAFYGRKSLETNIHIYSEAVCPAIRPTPSAAAGNPFKRQQRGFSVRAAGISGQAAVRAEYAVAGDHQ